MEKVKQANRGLSEAELNSISGLVSTYIADIKANVLNPKTRDYYQILKPSALTRLYVMSSLFLDQRLLIYRLFKMMSIQMLH
ncbi:unnamed protein product [Peronospora belbahrii]|uniref:Rpn11/EIF3F C-terminal domain-containing protein n=1 Tax=Peronospora belbahrii TaxID=622444 RepID=A0AAU9KID5_9STRA|nr:unnamed protein product [Peronospora belbahrii]